MAQLPDKIGSCIFSYENLSLSPEKVFEMITLNDTIKRNIEVAYIAKDDKTTRVLLIFRIYIISKNIRKLEIDNKIPDFCSTKSQDNLEFFQKMIQSPEKYDHENKLEQDYNEDIQDVKNGKNCRLFKYKAKKKAKNTEKLENNKKDTEVLSVKEEIIINKLDETNFSIVKPEENVKNKKQGKIQRILEEKKNIEEHLTEKECFIEKLSNKIEEMEKMMGIFKEELKERDILIKEKESKILELIKRLSQENTNSEEGKIEALPKKRRKDYT